MAKLTKLTKLSNAAYLATAKKAKSKKPAITAKHVMLLDTGDGAYVDASVKVKPHKTDSRKLVLKCTSAERLFDAAERMGLSPCGGPIKGAKHYILFVWQKDFQVQLAGQQQAQVAPKPAKQIKSKAQQTKAKQAKAKKTKYPVFANEFEYEMACNQF